MPERRACALLGVGGTAVARVAMSRQAAGCVPGSAGGWVGGATRLARGGAGGACCGHGMGQKMQGRLGLLGTGHGFQRGQPAPRQPMDSKWLAWHPRTIDGPLQPPVQPAAPWLPALATVQHEPQENQQDALSAHLRRPPWTPLLLPEPVNAFEKGLLSSGARTADHAPATCLVHRLRGGRARCRRVYCGACIS